MKNTIYLICSILIFFIFSSCEKDLGNKEEEEALGKQAAIEFCDCYKQNSKDNCLDKLKENYHSSDYMSNDFIDAFNQQSSCGIKLEKIVTQSKASPLVIEIVD